MIRRCFNWVNRYASIEPTPDVEMECPRTSGLEYCRVGRKADMLKILSENFKFRQSRHYTCIVKRQNTEIYQNRPIGAIPEQRLYQTYSKQLLRSLIRYYCETMPHVGVAKPSLGKYKRGHNGEIVKERLKPGKDVEFYNRPDAHYLSFRGNELAPNKYQNTLNYLLEYELPLKFYNYDPSLPFEILNVGVGTRGQFDSAILFRHFGNLNYYSAEMPNIRSRHPHSALAIRSNMTQNEINSRTVSPINGVAGFNPDMRGRIDLAIMIHPNPRFAVKMIIDSIDFIKSGDQGLLLVVIRKEDYDCDYDLSRSLYSFPKRNDIKIVKSGRLNFTIEDDNTATHANRFGENSGMHGRLDYFFMYRLIPTRNRFPGFNIRNMTRPSSTY